jgi:hypothetical protein
VVQVLYRSDKREQLIQAHNNKTINTMHSRSRNPTNVPVANHENDGDDWHSHSNMYGGSTGSDDPWAATRMTLTPDELRWARDVKAAIVADPEIDNLSDFMYAQWALMCQNNVEQAVHKARQLQWFREEYGISDCTEQCRQMVVGACTLCPGGFLSLSYNHRDGNYVLIYDMAAIDSHKCYATVESTRVSLGSVYYMFQAMNPDFQAIRQGIVFLVECSGFDWRQNMDLASFRKAWCELLLVYPKRFQKIKYFNTGVFMNLMNSLKKRFLPKHIMDKIDSTCKLDGCRLSDLYAVPTLEACHQRLLARVEDSIWKRQQNEASFRLDDLETDRN